eukprot:Em0004g901a
MACRTNPTPGIRVHWSGACGPHLHRLPYPVDTTHPRWQSSGDVMVISNVAGLPLSLPATRMSAGVVCLLHTNCSSCWHDNRGQRPYPTGLATSPSCLLVTADQEDQEQYLDTISNNHIP